MEGEEPEVELDVNSIDAHWIESQLLPHYEASEALRMSKQIHSVLNGKTTMEVENDLLSILNYEKFELVSLLLKNRKAIYHCVRYWQAPGEKDREALLEKMN